MRMHEQWLLHCSSQWGWYMLSSEHVYCVAIAFKMTEWGEQWICIKFCVKLEHSSAETIWVMQLWVTGDWQLHCYNMPAHVSRLVQSFLEKHQITQVTWTLYSPDLVPCNFWLFPKLKLSLTRKRFQTIGEIEENMTGQLMAIRRTVWDSKVPTLKGTEVLCTSLSYVQCFLYLVFSS